MLATHLWGIEFNTCREIRYLCEPMYYFLYLYKYSNRMIFLMQFGGNKHHKFLAKTTKIAWAHRVSAIICNYTPEKNLGWLSRRNAQVSCNQGKIVQSRVCTWFVDAAPTFWPLWWCTALYTRVQITKLNHIQFVNFALCYTCTTLLSADQHQVIFFKYIISI